MRDKPLILVVDDEPDLLEIMTVNLSRSGFDPVAARNAREGIDATKKLRPDLVLMDVKMPGETGTDAALAIKQDPELKDIKIAFLSNMKDPWPTTSASREMLAKELGMEDFIEKTADWPTTLAKIQEILAKK